MPIVTLLTDFGTTDSYVAEMKGILLSGCPGTTLVDVTHAVPPGDVRSGAYLLGRAWPRFPGGTLHLAVVDPGVGTERAALAFTAHGHWFVGPDNGLFTQVFHDAEVEAVTLPVPAGAAPTFHGRDVFAPVAGALSLGTQPNELGPEVTDFVRLPFAAPFQRDASTLVATVIHVDRFGNCVTNVTPRDIGSETLKHGVSLVVAGREIRTIRRFFADDAGAPSEPFAVWGSAGLLEIAVFQDSAAHSLGLKRGSEVELLFRRAG